jgi:hypothetical protein
MAVAAQQNALPRLHPRFLKGPGHPIEPKVELLGGRIKVMELKNLLASVIAAYQAFASSLFH